VDNNLSLSEEILTEFGFKKKAYSRNITNSFFLEINEKMLWACLVTADALSEPSIAECYWGINSEPIYCNNVRELRNLINVLSVRLRPSEEL